ncbi:MAG TPA: acyltransferase family protein [Ilumatobacteraceae bacterium]|nr:acyltransferase family protein [Ilumatobacteraceae bacterium]
MTASTDAAHAPTRADVRPRPRAGVRGNGAVERTGGPRASAQSVEISRVPYLPGLDGMRALAVVAVMVYHANADWLPGGYLGVEVFFVISGYLITLLLISEKERTSTVDMRQFWIRRGRRLLPALFTMLLALTIWVSIFERDELGKLRGDVIASVAYVANWYQIWTGAGYTAANDFAPLRHLWSLAVEEQFYLVWPLVMVALLRGGTRRIADISRWLVVAALAITVFTAVTFYAGPIGTPEVTPDAYWSVLGRDISIFDWSYLGTFTRASGLLLGAAFAMIWRPVAVMRGPLRTKGALLDVVSVGGFAILAAMVWFMWLVGPDGGNPWLFRGGFLLCAIATLMMVAAVTHERALTSRLLSIPVLLWIGTRSYGLYLYHWPIYQLMRGIAGKPLTLTQFAVAMVITGVITELSYRYIETPIRKRTLGESWRRIRRSPVAGPRTALLAAGAVVGALALFATVSLATAPVIENEVRQSLDEAAAATCDVVNDPDCDGVIDAATDGGVDPGVLADPSDDAADPAATVPGGSAVPVPPSSIETTTTAPPAPIAKLALGDSVMQGAATQLAADGFTVDAIESRAFVNGLDTVLTLNDQGRLGDVVVVHLGTNGPINTGDMARMMETLAAVPQVLLLTIDVDRPWTAANNGLIYDAINTYPNVSLLDWAGLASSCPGDCFYSDGFHLRPAGQEYYATLISSVLQTPA